MAKYTKQRKTEKKGWRPSESSLPEGIRATDLDKMAQSIQQILADSHISTQAESALLEQVRLLCLRVQAYQDGNSISLNQLNDELSKHNDELHRYGFKENRDIIPLNLWITRRLVLQKGDVEELLRQVESKKKEAK